MKQPKTFKATTLRGILSIFLVVALALCCGGFYLALGWVKGYAAQVNAIVVQSKASGNSAVSLGIVQSQLTKNQALIGTVDTLFAPAATYQQQAIQDINTYAERSGLGVSDIKTGDTTTAAVGAATAPVAGLTTVSPSQTVTLTLSSPVSYASLIKFMTYIEQAAPITQIANIDISGDLTVKNAVAINTLTLQVFTK